MPVGRHHATGNLRYNVQHIPAKPLGLLGRHPVGIVLHTFYYLLVLHDPDELELQNYNIFFDKNK
jgi:hypothetical protein